jgi:hypothetical protein
MVLFLNFFFYLYIKHDYFIHKYVLFWRILYMRNLVYKICLHHHTADTLLKLALNTNQAIIPASSNSFSLFQLSCGTSDIIFKLMKAVKICLCLNFYFRCEASAKNNTNIEIQVSTCIYISYMLQQNLDKLCLFTFPVQLVKDMIWLFINSYSTMPYQR